MTHKWEIVFNYNGSSVINIIKVCINCSLQHLYYKYITNGICITKYRINDKNYRSAYLSELTCGEIIALDIL